MHLYWRIQQDLSCLGEIIHFHDPSLLRWYQQWLHRNAVCIAQAEGFRIGAWLQPNMN